jgi:hypothetical protein
MIFCNKDDCIPSAVRGGVPHAMKISDDDIDLLLVCIAWARHDIALRGILTDFLIFLGFKVG